MILNIPKDAIRLITFNILRDYPNEEPHTWKTRRHHIISLLRFHAPDLFALQEPKKNQVDDIAQAFADYGTYGVGRDDGIHKGEHVPIFYEKNTFDVLDKGHFWLSETPDVIASKGWDAAITRTAVWMKLRQKASGKAFMIMNTHFDHKGQEAMAQSALLIDKKIKELAGDLPVLFCGDLNSVQTSIAYQNLISSGFTDAAYAQGITSYGPPFTYHNFISTDEMFAKSIHAGKKMRALEIIDYIFTKGPVRVLRHGVLGDHFLGDYPSDHMPKLCDVVIESSQMT